MKTFQELNLQPTTLSALNSMGFEEATPIQAKTIPVALAGRDLIGQAQTGTGKTAAFGIPLIEKVNIAESQIQGIILTPTRELAVQVAEELNKIGQFKGVKALPIYGGQDINKQIKALKSRPHIIVGTPGRTMDHMRRKNIRLDGIETVILDEADEMLNMGFMEDVEVILQETPAERQTFLFSATMPKRIQDLAQRFLNNPEFISVQAKEMTVPNIQQQYIEIHEREKFDVLCRLIDIQSPELAIVFGRTKRRVDELSEALAKRGYPAEGIHGDLTQAKRDTVLRKFKEGTIDVLVATDVAARGLDISGVTHVYNFDLPQDPEGYVHRIGRTGRAGKTGLALSFVTPREISHLRVIENLIKRKLERKPVPTINEALEGQQHLTVKRLLQAVEEGNFEHYKGLAEDLLERTDSVTLISAALKVLTKEPDFTPVQLTEESPLRAKKDRSRRDTRGGGFRNDSRGDFRGDSRGKQKPKGHFDKQSKPGKRGKTGNQQAKTGKKGYNKNYTTV